MSKQKETLFQKLNAKTGIKHEEEDLKLKKNITYKVIILFISITLCSLFFSFHLYKNDSISNIGLVPGIFWNGKTITADFTFPVKKSKEFLENEQEEAASKALPVYRHIGYASNSTFKKLRYYLDVKKFSIDSNIYSPYALNAFSRINNDKVEDNFKGLINEVANVLADFYQKGVVATPVSEISTNTIIGQDDNSTRVYISKSVLFDSLSFTTELISRLQRSTSIEMDLIISELVPLIYTPNLIYSETLSELHKKNIKKNVPHTLGLVRKDDVILQNGERITNLHLAKMNSYKEAKLASEPNQSGILEFIGSFGHVGIIFSLILIYLFFIRKKIFYDNFQITLICTLLIISSLLAWLTVDLPIDIDMEYLIFMPALSMLAAIVFDSRTAFYLTITMALLIAGIRAFDYGTGLMMMFAGSLAAFTVKDIQSRTQIYRSIFYIFIGFALPIIFLSLERGLDLFSILEKLGLSLINSAVSPIITFGILFVVEKFTTITTDLKLEEFDNLDHPLLQKMSEIAPGTYQHSLGVAFLSERCASAVGANELFVKVTSYFHDIGKMERPEYFAENQLGYNKHDAIPPKRSAVIIKEHVTRGAEMAVQYKLPSKIIDIIQMHHGTSLIAHFYAKAVEQYGLENVDKEDYQYPGPKPDSKEAAIVMICDTAEAISRLEGRTQEQMDAMVKKIIDDKFIEGQFSDCDITGHELRIIANTISKNITGMRHKRVEYKKVEPNKFEANE